MRNLATTFSYRWFEEVWNNLQRDSIEMLVNNNAIIHNVTGDNADDIGIAAFRQFYDDFTAQFKNIRVTVEDVVSQDDMETARLSVTAFHIPSQQDVEIKGTTIIRLRNDKIAEAWNYFATQPLRNLLTP